MKLKTFFSIISLILFFQTSAQSIGVEKSIWGIQTGILGIWAQNEYRLSDKIALRSEIGFDGGFRITGSTEVYALTPTLKIEPRWYYNLNKRHKKGKNISMNSGNFIAVSFSYLPNWFVISNTDNIYTPDQITIIPKWAIRRTIGKHFAYETGFGIGYAHEFESNSSGTAVDLHLRIGYTF